LKCGKYRLYSRKQDPETGKHRNLVTFDTRKEGSEPFRYLPKAVLFWGPKMLNY
jgi:hypothetical protein